MFSLQLNQLSLLDPKNDGPFLSIDQAKIYYNPFKLFSLKSKPIDALGSIYIKNGRLYLHCNNENIWNFENFHGKSKKKFEPILYKGKVYIRDFSVTYRDDVGFGSEKLSSPFIETFVNLQGSIFFSNPQKALYTLTGKSVLNRAPVYLSGYLNTVHPYYSLVFELPHFNLDQWGRYILPFKGVSLRDKNILLKGEIRHRILSQVHDPGLWFDLSAYYTEATCKLPFFEKPFEKIKGAVSFYNCRLSRSDIKQLSPSLSEIGVEAIWQDLISKHVINSRGEIILNTLPNPLLIPSLKAYEEVVFSLLSHPPMRLVLGDTMGLWNQISLKGNGYVDVQNKTLNLMVQASSVAIKKAMGSVSYFQSISVSGNTELEMAITGSFDHPIFSGKASSKQVKIGKSSPQNISLVYRLDHKILSFNVLSAEWFGGILSLKGQLSLDKPLESLSIHCEGNGMDINQLLQSKRSNISGNIMLQGDLKGSSEGIRVSFLAKSNQCVFYNQNIQELKASFLLSENKTIDQLSAELKINHSLKPLKLEGKTTSYPEIVFALHGEDIVLHDPSPRHQYQSGRLAMDGVLSIVYSPMFWDQPLNYLSATFNAVLSNYSIFNHSFEKTVLSFVYKDAVTELKTVEASNGLEKIVISGRLNGAVPQNLQVHVQNLQINNAHAIQQVLPEFLRPVTAILSGKANVVLASENRVTSANPWSSYRIEGDVTISDLNIPNQVIDQLNTRFSWDSHHLSFDQLRAHRLKSFLELSGIIKAKGDMDFILSKASIDLEDLSLLTRIFKKHEGHLITHGAFSFRAGQPSMNFILDAKDIKLDSFGLSKLEGGMVYSDHKLLLNQVRFQENQQFYQLNGWYFFAKHSEKIAYDMKVLIKNGRLETLNMWRRTIEVLSKMTDLVVAKNQTPFLSSFPGKIQDKAFEKNNVSLFQSGEEKHSFSFFNKILSHKHSSLEERRLFRESEKISISDKSIHGLVSGVLHAQSSRNFPSINALLLVSELESPLLSATQLNVSVQTSVNQELIFDTDFHSGRLLGADFDRFLVSGVLGTNFIRIDHSDLKNKNYNAKDLLVGVIPLSTDIPLSLKLNLKGNSIDLIRFLNPNIEHIRNEGELSLWVEGSMNSPKVSGELRLKNASVLFSKEKFNSASLFVASANLLISDNSMNFVKTRFIWRNGGAEGYEIQGSGNIGLLSPNLRRFDHLDVFTDLCFSSKKLSIDIPLLYKGEIYFDQLNLKGKYHIPFSETALQGLKKRVENNTEEGPRLSGEIYLSNGVIDIPKVEEGVKPSLHFDLAVHIREDIQISGSLLGKSGIAGIAIELDLDKTSSPLLIKGSINRMQVFNALTIKDGTVHLLNRDFVLLSQKEQKAYSPDQRDNSLSFESKGEDRKQRLILNISALSIFEQSSEKLLNGESAVSSVSKPKKMMHVLTQIRGPVSELDTLSFFVFESTSSVATPGDLKPIQSYVFSTKKEASSSDATELMRVLFPEVFQSVDANKERGEDPNSLIAGFGEKRVNFFVKKGLRPIEKQIAKKIGIEDLSIDYNLGADLFRQQDSKKIVGINVIKNVSKQLFVRIKSNIDLRSERTSMLQQVGVSEVELTYFIIPNRLSFNYANIKNEETDVFKPKLSLKYNYDY